MEDQAAAQKLLDAQPWHDWSAGLNALLAQACSALAELQMQDRPLQYYWSAAETEWASDVMFRSPAALQALYPGLLQHAMTTFGSDDVMRFLGQKTTASGTVHGRFQGEVVSDLNTRPEVVNIKHRANANLVKIYNKQGSVLRVEMTINDTSDFNVHRASEDNPQGPKSLRKMRKGVVELPTRAAASQAANHRYLESLAGVETAAPLSQVLDQLAKPVTHNGHRIRGLQPLVGADAQLAQHLLRGEFSLHGFRNRDLREPLFGPKSDPADIRRDSGKVSRLLRLFRDHGLIDRVKGTHRYQLTAHARRTLPGLLAIRNTNTKRLNELVV